MNKYFSFNDNSEGLTPKILRLGLLLAFFLFGGFGILDYYALPENMSITFMIRFMIVFPLIAIVFGLTYLKKLEKHIKIILMLLLSAGQLGIVVMILISSKSEPAYYSYYAGLILVILWASYVFQLRFNASLYIAISTILFFNLTIWIRTLINGFEFSETDKTYLIISNFFLVSSALLSLIGSFLLDRKDKIINKAYIELIEERNSLELAKNKAEESDKLKESFINNMSHEIRTPLNAILGFIDILNRPGFSKSEKDEFLKMINESAERLMNTVEGMLEISKIKSQQVAANIQSFDYLEVLHKVYYAHKGNAEEKGLEYSFIADNDLDNNIIKSDKGKLSTIVNVLIGNAIKFTAEGKVVIESHINENNLIIRVIDTGEGIAREKHELVFEPFMQADMSDIRLYEGSGLGLAICKAYVKALSGEIDLYSVVGEGSTFTITLPIIKE